MEREKFKVSEIAKMLGVSKIAVYNWLKDGLDYEWDSKIGARPYRVISLKDVEEYMDKRKAKYE